jgi:5-oxoprolinase (ATP-hydrolysing)
MQFSNPTDPAAAAGTASGPGRGWYFFVDRGGTFTDLVAIAPDGRLLTHKLLSESPRYADAALEGIDRLRSTFPVGERAIAGIRMGTTIGTNALLERRGASTVLVITAGFGDLLRIGTQQRPDIFALDIELPATLYSFVVEARERIAADGAILQALDRAGLARDLRLARAAGAGSVAIALVNAYREPRHERDAAAIAREAGFAHVSVSTEINPAIRLVDRGDTAVVDAYLTPVLESYKKSLGQSLAAELAGDRLWFMQSHGGLVDAAGFRGCDSVLSGPAGGVVGMATTAQEAGFDDVIGFDMGGTSTDVSVFAGRYERTLVSRVAGTRIARPMLRINTVAAGGGSVLSYRGGRLQVGPESAGAYPGPACYRNGGPLTLTDANVCLGRIQADRFPRVFGPDARDAIDLAAVEAGFARLARAIVVAGGREMSPVELAEGFRRIAIAGMAAAIEQISVQRGHDATRFALACFGGAGGQHACGVADALGVETILVHPLSGVLSAYGIGVAERRSIRNAGIHAGLDERSLGRSKRELARLRTQLAPDFGHAARFEGRAWLCAAGSDTLLDVPLGDDSGIEALRERFAERHRKRFGFDPDSRTVLHSIEVEAVAPTALPKHSLVPRAPLGGETAAARPIWLAGQWVRTPVHDRAALGIGVSIEGPALIAEDNATIIVEPGWRASVADGGMLIVRRSRPRRPREAVDTDADPIMLEIFNNQFMHIAEQMGAVLEQTAHSVNIKERLDYSCALFDGGGELIANAPHVPVHLGSMSDSVREVIAAADELDNGDAWMLNAPYRGGTHLPDITVVTPVFAGAADSPDFFVASRAHHADIGGTMPGSMPASSQRIEEEGVVIEPMRILRGGVLLEAAVVDVLGTGPYPARNALENLADLKAQLAANARGRLEIERLLARYGKRVVQAYMRHARDNAELCAREVLRGLRGGRFDVTMDSGERIAVEVTVDRDRGEARIDFGGTSGMSAGNLNAPRSVVRAVVLYVLRTLIREDIPLNGGCLVPIELVIPERCLLDPVPPAAVAGGNVETSQCIADCLLAAFGAVAASQGTMNNFTFGDDEHQYYETICGGAGAGPGFDGASAVHTHMTNSRLTDVEVLEQRFPVRLVRFAIRKGSGGGGRWRGGDGVVREIEFLAPLRAGLIANRRRVAPFGLAGGADGAPGRDTILRADGSVEPVPPAAELALAPGDRIVIETPGGGGWGVGSEPLGESGVRAPGALTPDSPRGSDPGFPPS